ncbi:hypothetical protein CORC01_09375 [Colletotrichum orchidophilum]|uniref:DNA/RNA-binding protein Alba-like domain-containing protein n=1 Tax=Colletotrichum orchidophilum TaxID=1209926 RepID=A0A1G4B1U2_9PEZI|nr:uncharacterized protein CORC01_09375 [Colletotrichum orchidophilum]OHE95364.1 hypothetical protein CORC01_09375 [Colletotrichum orchidophilum]
MSIQCGDHRAPLALLWFKPSSRLTVAESSATQPKGSDKKRKSSTMAESAAVSKKSKATTATATATASGPTTPLPPSHEALLAELRSKYDILPAFTISSTKIQKRVTWLLQHLRQDDGDPRKRAVLVYARPGEVAKMISIVETVKRIVATEKEGEGEEESGKWYQYNLMYELPPKADIVEETVLGGGPGESGARDGSDGEEDDDDFEVMESRFERAVLPQPAKRAAKSLSIFLSLVPMPELKARDGVTTQTNASQDVKASSTAL